jgi:hypothetical protein
VVVVVVVKTKCSGTERAVCCGKTDKEKVT